ncbi:MAG: hypothetical protein NC313_17320, partial [Butyrivibrio sp.]|nr:hypothetical protein [Butyrivibrio sp.]
FEDMRLEGYEAGIVEGMTAGRSEGIAVGRLEGIAAEMAIGIEKLIKTVRNLGASKEAACEQLVQQYALKENEANEKINLYWTD